MQGNQDPLITLYRKSDLYRGIQNQKIVFYEDYHLVGDLAYTGSPRTGGPK
jgi:hypothetical protein